MCVVELTTKSHQCLHFGIKTIRTFLEIPIRLTASGRRWGQIAIGILKNTLSLAHFWSSSEYSGPIKSTIFTKHLKIIENMRDVRGLTNYEHHGFAIPAKVDQASAVLKSIRSLFLKPQALPNLSKTIHCFPHGGDILLYIEPCGGAGCTHT